MTKCKECDSGTGGNPYLCPECLANNLAKELLEKIISDNTGDQA